MAKKGSAPAPHKKARIEIIPLIDIMFFLLASFMLVSLSMIKLQAIDTKVPPPNNGPKPPPNPDVIVIGIDKHGLYYFAKEKTPMAPTDIQRRLSPLYEQQKEDLKVFINADQDALTARSSRRLMQFVRWVWPRFPSRSRWTIISTRPPVRASCPWRPLPRRSFRFLEIFCSLMQPPSLFRNRPIRRWQLALMVFGSLVVHGSLVGIGYAVWQPISKPLEIPVTEVDIQAGDPDVRELIVPMDAPTPPPDMPTPPPDMTPPPDDTPPPTEEPDMEEPDKPTPSPKPKTEVKRYAATPAPPGAKRGEHPQAGVVGGNPNGTKATGIPGGGGSATKGWTTPTPIYPAAARASHIQGSTTVEVTTDASGNIASVTVIKSAGSPILDFNTKSYVKNNWKGPPSSTRTREFSYVLH